MELWLSKLLAFCIVFGVMAICGLLPIKVADWFNKKGEKGVYYLSVISCFGGGVFFGAYLMHMAPETREMLEDSWLNPKGISYPIPELFTGFGFFLLLYVDKFAMMLSKGGKKKDDKNVAPMEKKEGVENHAYSDGVQLTGVVHSIRHEHGGNGVVAPPSTLIQGKSITENLTHLQPASKNQVSSGDVEKAELADTSYEHDAADNDLSARPYIFLAALSLDCIFEGMSLGLQTTSYGVWILVIAILSHETVICFSFGLRVLKLFPTRKVIFLVVGYAATIPIGLALGLVIFETAGATDEIDIVSGCFLAISAGIFIYVSFFEILNEELTHDSHISKLIACTVGFIFMALMVLVDLIDNGSGGEGESGGNITTVAY